MMKTDINLLNSTVKQMMFRDFLLTFGALWLYSRYEVALLNRIVREICVNLPLGKQNISPHYSSLTATDSCSTLWSLFGS